MRLQNLLTLAAAAAAVSAKHAPKLANPCLQKPYATLPFCNASLSDDQRARDAVGRMSLSEKIDALGSKQGPTPSLGLGTYDWWSEATSGIANGEHGAPGEHTHFAYPVTTGMAFNRSLWRATGYAIGREARALMNAGQAYSTLWAPVVNLALHPRWGRNIEVPGEDPFLTGEYAFAFIRGLQNEEGGFLQASACCKHFVANELEKTTQPDGEEWDRRHDDAQVTERDLADSYFPPFQACVKAGVTGLMCSYNALNGVPACANKKLLDTARSWGFNGYVTSDCDADRNVFNTHKYAPTRTEAVRDVLGAGTDVDCGGFVSRHARAALDEGLIDENLINERLVNLFTVRLRLGHFDLSFDVTRPRGPLDRITAQAVCAEAHRETSREGLAQAATLYKNNGVLPLCAKTVLVSGPTANISRATASYYGPRVVCEGAYPGLIDAVRDGGRVQVTYEQDLSRAVAAAKTVDAVVLALGTDLDYAREGRDAPAIRLPADQLRLATAVAAAARSPITIVLLTATPLDVASLLANPKVGAIAHLGQPSVAVVAFGDLLYGRRSFSGRAVQTVYPATYEDAISIADFNLRPGPSALARPDCAAKNASRCPRGTNPGRTYRFYEGTSVVPFGFGLSYTSFRYGLRVVAASFVVAVTNTGNMAADDVVLLFLVPPGAGTDGVALKSLVAFDCVHVPINATVSVTLSVPRAAFASAGVYTVEAGVCGDARMGFDAATVFSRGDGGVVVV